MQLSVRPQALESLLKFTIIKFALLVVSAIPATITSVPQPSATLFLGNPTSISLVHLDTSIPHSNGAKFRLQNVTAATPAFGARFLFDCQVRSIVRFI